jgi:predicted permease
MLSDLLYRLRAVFRRSIVERELEDELRFHVEEQASKYARAGTSAAEAERMARRDLEGPEQAKERCRDARGTVLWDTTMQDLRYAVRQLRSAPGFSGAVIAVLALGIGANTAIFSLLDAVVLRSLPVRDPQQLLVPRWTAKATPNPYDEDDYELCFGSRVPDVQGSCTFSYPLFKFIESKSDIFSSVTAFAGPVSLSANANGSAAVIDGDIVSGNFFQTLGVGAILGRTFKAGDDTPTAPATVVLSYGYWRSAFGGNPSVLGKAIRLNAVPFTVIGVAEPSFNRLSPGRVCELWMPIHAGSNLGISGSSLPLDSEHHFWLRIIGRAKPRITAAGAAAALTALVRNQMVYQSKVLKPDSDPAVEVVPAHKALIGDGEILAQPLYVLMCAVGLILLIACANVAGLMTARATARQREIAIRLAIGAGRVRVIRQLLTESIAIGALGGLAGLAIAWLATQSLTSFLPMHLDVQPDLRILLFTSGISLASGILFGMAPALRTTRVHSSSSFDTSSVGLQYAMSSSARRRWFSNSLVAAQVALAVVMLMGAGLFVRTLINLKSIDPGFNPRNLLLFGLDPVSLHYKEPRIQSLYRTLRDRLASLPGVTGVTYSSSALLSNSLSSSEYQIEGRRDTTPAHINILGVGPNFFQTMGIQLVTGRAFTPAEFADGRSVAVVNQAFVKEYLAGHNALGLHFGEDSPKAAKEEIVGVAGNAKYNSLREDIKPTAYMPLLEHRAFFELRTAYNPSSLIPAVRKIVREADPNLPLFHVVTQTEMIDETLIIERLVARLSTAFGLLAITLACIGLYGLLSYEVARRTREIGIRMAIGAEPATVRRGVLRETLGIVLIGLVIGIPAALVATRALSAMLYGVQTNDPVTLVIITSVLLIVSGIAGYLPARRASLVDPTVALRYE